MTRDIESAMAEYLQVADSLERWDAKPIELKPVLRALGRARRHLIDRMTAFERTLERDQQVGLDPASAVASIPAMSEA